MYLLFRFHHITPGQYYRLGTGEKKIIKAFMQQQIEDLEKRWEEG